MASVDATLAYANQLKGLLAKADGKDKFIALVQYVAMFTSAGQPGVALAVQKSLGAARKPFRVFKPVEFLMPLLEKPPKGRGMAAALAYTKAIGMAVYMGADHLVWASSAGVIANKDLAKTAQKLSLWGWFAASVASVATLSGDLTAALDDMSAAGEDEEAKRAAAARTRSVMMGVLTNGAQAALALALLEKLPLDKRQTGALGVALSLVNCYNLAPPLKRKTA